MEPYRIPWSLTWKCMGLPWNYIEFQRSPWNSREFHEVPRNSMDFHGIPWGYFTGVKLISK